MDAHAAHSIGAGDSPTEVIKDPVLGQFEFALKGRGFSRAANASKSIAALAAAGRVFQTDHHPRPEFLSEEL
jgi:hypothetical protein